MESFTPTRIKLTVNGIVQGVGFRPFVYNLAQKFNLSGFVSNTRNGVEIQVEGPETATHHFVRGLSTPPPLARIRDISQNRIKPLLSKTFEIRPSTASNHHHTFVSPDVSICSDCLDELFDSTNRRYMFPFINCTHCGPRFTIIKSLPYDRQNTAMANFTMCAECRKEYENPSDRRFHAQPNCCPVCGPRVWYETHGDLSAKIHDSWLQNAIDDLINGKIVAVKGLGGFHLAVNATDKKAVRRLRLRKNRQEKPFALMVADIHTAEQLVKISKAEAACLQSQEKPILLSPQRENSPIAEAVEPGYQRLGIMLPYTPLHYILLDQFQKTLGGSVAALVMTSGNLSTEPIATTNQNARTMLGSIADSFIMHDRDILTRADDSVAVFANDRQHLLRYSRGYAPRPLELGMSFPAVLGLGAELKNTLCLIKNETAFPSQHIGDLTNYRAYESFVDTIQHLESIIQHKAKYLACDLHPDYLSTKWANQQSQLPVFKVQHHHAHMAACMAEHLLNEKVIAVILDGAGLGYDGAIWGGEFFMGDYLNLQRIAQFEYMPLPGGDAAIREPWRAAVGYLFQTFDGKLPTLPGFFDDLPVKQITKILQRNLNCPLTSSAGRLFDVVSALAGGPFRINYEAQAAISLMHAVKSTKFEAYPFDIIETGGSQLVNIKSLIRHVYEDVMNNIGYSQIAGKFHRTLADIISRIVLSARESFKLNKVILSGGVFQNEILLTLTQIELEKQGFAVYTPVNLPMNDGGIALGQAVTCGHWIKNNLNHPNIKL